MQLYLLSNSLRRRELIKFLPFDTKVLSIDFDESIDYFKIKDTSAKSIVRYICFSKAKQAREYFKKQSIDNYIAICADTIVFKDNTIYQKPKDKNDALNMLLQLNGQKHSVLTQVCIITNKKIYNFCDKSTVTFKNNSVDDINNYLQTQDKLDKAGSYGIQDKSCNLIENIKGDYFNIVGLNVTRLYKKLCEIQSKEKININ